MQVSTLADEQRLQIRLGKNFSLTSVQLQVPGPAQLHSNFIPTSVSNFSPTSVQLQSNFIPTSVQLHSNFSPASVPKLRKTICLNKVALMEIFYDFRFVLQIGYSKSLLNIFPFYLQQYFQRELILDVVLSGFYHDKKGFETKDFVRNVAARIYLKKNDYFYPIL